MGTGVATGIQMKRIAERLSIACVRRSAASGRLANAMIASSGILMEVVKNFLGRKTADDDRKIVRYFLSACLHKSGVAPE